jgi:hypothetical protein
MRREFGNMERLILQGKVEGTRLQGRSQMRWTDQITKSSGKTMHALTTKALTNSQWPLQSHNGLQTEEEEEEDGV